MKEYNCPDCQLDSCEQCPRYLISKWSNTDREKYKSFLDKTIQLKDYFIQTNNTEYIPNCCKNCSNHPSNGGTGICWCTQPYFSDPQYNIN